MGSRKDATHALIIVEILALVVVLIFGVLQKGKITKQDDIQKTSQQNTQNIISENVISDVEETQTEEQEVKQVVFSEQVTQKLSSMTLEEKVAQMFVISPEMLTNMDESVNVAGDATANAINTYPVGGLVYSAQNFMGKEQAKKLLSRTQQYSVERIGLPMFLAVEEMGGEAHSPVATKVDYRVQSALTDVKDVEEAKKTAGNISTYLTEIGFTMNIVPFGSLAFSSDVANTSVLVAESIATYDEKAMTTAVGVFPGSVEGKDFNAWKETDALVFKSAINAGCDSIVVGNVLYKELTEDDTTICSMSKNVVQYIRGDMGFEGVIMTDSLSKEVVTLNYSSKEAAVMAVQAGVNMLFCPQNFVEAYQGIIDAVNNNEIKMETIDESVGRILTQKMSGATQE